MNSSECHWVTNCGAIRILPERGRLLGMEVFGHQALWQPASVEAQWNLGGERLWIGPERDWFWQQTDKVDFSQYLVPPTLNPDLWKVLETGHGHASAEIRIVLRCAHSPSTCDLHIHRTWDLLTPDNPQDVSISLRSTTRVDILGIELAADTGSVVDLGPMWNAAGIDPRG